MKVAPTTAKVPQYIRDIHKVPMLSADEERRLARRWRESQDNGAADKLVAAHLRLVVKIALGYRGYGLPLDELIGEGNCGMVEAVRRFDPERGFRLATYAMWWIRAAIAEYVLHSRSLVKMGTTGAQKKLFFNLRRLKGQLQALQRGDLEPAEVTKIAKVLKVPEHEVVSMNSRLAGPDHSLNAPMNADGQGEWQDLLMDESKTQEENLADREELGKRREFLAHAWGALSDRERHIMTERWLADETTTLEVLALHYGISRERIRQIENRAFQKLQKAIKAQMLQTDRAHAVRLSSCIGRASLFMVSSARSEPVDKGDCARLAA